MDDTKLKVACRDVVVDDGPSVIVVSGAAPLL
jgi:hypothetical protein